MPSDTSAQPDSPSQRLSARGSIRQKDIIHLLARRAHHRPVQPLETYTIRTEHGSGTPGLTASAPAPGQPASNASKTKMTQPVSEPEDVTEPFHPALPFSIDATLPEPVTDTPAPSDLSSKQCWQELVECLYQRLPTGIAWQQDSHLREALDRWLNQFPAITDQELVTQALLDATMQLHDPKEVAHIFCEFMEKFAMAESLDISSPEQALTPEGSPFQALQGLMTFRQSLVQARDNHEDEGDIKDELNNLDDLIAEISHQRYSPELQSPVKQITTAQQSDAIPALELHILDYSLSHPGSELATLVGMDAWLAKDGNGSNIITWGLANRMLQNRQPPDC